MEKRLPFLLSLYQKGERLMVQGHYAAATKFESPGAYDDASQMASCPSAPARKFTKELI